MTYEEALRATGPKAWEGLSEGQKIDALQALEDRAARESGRLPRPIVSAWLYTAGDGVVLGCYDPQRQTISINASQLGEGAPCGRDPTRIVETVFHEGRHAYQRDVVEGRASHVDSKQARAWKDNLAPGGYVRFWENPRAYYTQPVEADARHFAELRTARLNRERSELLSRDEAREPSRADKRVGWAKRAFEGEDISACVARRDDQRAAHVIRLA